MTAQTHELIAFVESRCPSPGIFVEVGESEPTLEAARWSLEIFTILGHQRDEDVLSLLAACRHSEGGFSMRPTDSSPGLEATYYATRIASLIGAHDMFDSALLHAWLRERVFDERGSVMIDSHQLFYAIKAFQLSDATLTYREYAAIAQLITQCSASQGGFSLLPGQQPDIERTYLCVNMLDGLQQLTQDDKKNAHASWTNSCFHQGRFYWDPRLTSYSLANTYWGARTAQMLDMSLAWEKIHQWVSSQSRGDGGYGDGARSTLWQTYCALGAIKIAEDEAGRKVVSP